MLRVLLELVTSSPTPLGKSIQLLNSKLWIKRGNHTWQLFINPMRESEIRDLLINQLGILQPTLQLVEKEKFFSSSVGTNSFIDILAKDDQGKYVIIELKRSNTSSREAIHELLKYIEALKENISVKEDEIKLIVVSTEWEELLVPFSSLLQKVNIQVEGYLLKIDTNSILSAEKIKPVSLVQDRVLSSIQMARYYSSEEAYNEGIKDHVECFKLRGVKDYVLVILEPPANYRQLVEDSIKGSMESLYEHFKNDPDLNLIGTEKKEVNVPDFQYMIYSSNQLLSQAEYIKVLKELSEYPDVIDEILDEPGMTNLDKLEQFNRELIHCEPFPSSDFVEIGTPAKFSKFLFQEGWEVVEIKRYGRIKENSLLTDEVILNEIQGTSGTNGQKYKSDIDFSDRSNISRVKREVGNCLSDNRVWKNHIFHVIDCLAEEQNVSEAFCSIFNPMNILYSIYLISVNSDGLLHIPMYQIRALCNNEERMYVGFLSGIKAKVSLDDVISEFYDGKKAQLFFSLTWGGYNSKNLDICKYIGLEYKTMLITKNGNERTAYNFENYAFEKTEMRSPIEDILLFIEKNKAFCNEVVGLFDNHLLEGGFFAF
jgi:hypothetical protein